MLEREWRAGARALVAAGMPAVMVGVVLVAAGCSDAPNVTLDAGAPVPDARVVLPGVHVVFPPSVSTTDRDMVRVRGTASLPGGVAAIRVNGVAAVSENGFLDWQALVPLATGANVLAVESEDGRGTVDAAAARVSVTVATHPLSAPIVIGVDEEDGRVLVLHQGDSVLAVDMATGERTPLFDLPRIESSLGYRWHAPVLDAARDRMLVLLDDESGSDWLYSVDLATGEAAQRFDFSSAFLESDMEMATVDSMVLDGEGNRVFVGGNGYMLEVDLVTGVYEYTSHFFRGSGPLPLMLAPLVWDAARGRLLVTGEDSDMLLAVDPVSGDRTVISDKRQPGEAALALVSTRAMVLDAQANRVLLTSDVREALLGIDLETGARALVEPDWGDLRPEELGRVSVSVDGSGRRLFIADERQDAILHLELDTGQAGIVSRAAVGSGPAVSATAAVVLQPDADRAWVLAAGRQALMSLDVDMGTREVRFDVPGGPSTGEVLVSSMALDAARGRMLLVDRMASELFAVDLETGQRAELDLESSGNGVPIFAPVAVVVDAARDRALVADVVDGDVVDGMSRASYNQIVAVDLDTGRRSVVAVLLAKDEGPWPRVTGMCLDLRHGRVLLADMQRMALWGMDLETGAIALVSGGLGGGPGDEARGSGPPLGRPAAVFLDAAGAGALVLDEARLLAVDLGTGARTLLAGDGAGSGPPLGWSVGAQVGVADTIAGRALVLGDDTGNGLGTGVLSVDLVTGERVFIAR